MAANCLNRCSLNCVRSPVSWFKQVSRLASESGLQDMVGSWKLNPEHVPRAGKFTTKPRAGVTQTSCTSSLRDGYKSTSAPNTRKLPSANDDARTDGTACTHKHTHTRDLSVPSVLQTLPSNHLIFHLLPRPSNPQFGCCSMHD